MRVSTQYGVEDIHRITQTLTEEAKDQVRLYHLSDPTAFILNGLNSSHEAYVIRDDDDIAIACAGVTHGSHFDNLFLVITTRVPAQYRQFCRLVVGWLGMRPRDVVVSIPERSTATLRMVRRWGFRVFDTFPQRSKSGEFPVHRLVYEKEKQNG